MTWHNVHHWSYRMFYFSRKLGLQQHTGERESSELPLSCYTSFTLISRYISLYFSSCWTDDIFGTTISPQSSLLRQDTFMFSFTFPLIKGASPCDVISFAGYFHSWANAVVHVILSYHHTIYRHIRRTPILTLPHYSSPKPAYRTCWKTPTIAATSQYPDHILHPYSILNADPSYLPHETIAYIDNIQINSS